MQLGAFLTQEQTVQENQLNGPTHADGHADAHADAHADEPNNGIVDEAVNESTSYEEESDVDSDEDNLWIDNEEEDDLDLFENVGNDDFPFENEEQQLNCKYYECS